MTNINELPLLIVDSSGELQFIDGKEFVEKEEKKKSNIAKRVKFEQYYDIHVESI